MLKREVPGDGREMERRGRTMREMREKDGVFPVRTMLLANNQEVNFYNSSDMDPVAEGIETTVLPPVFVKLRLALHEQMKRAWTLEKTFKNDEWQKDVATFVQKYLDTDAGKELLNGLDIKDVRLLHPSQAIHLTTAITSSLMRYDFSSLEEESSRRFRADDMTVVEILEEGLRCKDDSDWAGNGVCRNFAAVEYGVFEALKSQQGEGSGISGMEAFMVWGTEHSDKKIEHELFKIGDGSDLTHAWNVFLTNPRRGEMDISIVDPTWTKVIKKEGRIILQENDYSYQRMEGFIYALAPAIAYVEPESWSAIASFYKSMLEKFKERTELPAQHQRDYYAWRYLKISYEVLDEEGKVFLPGHGENIERIKEIYTAAFADPRMEISEHLLTELRILAKKLEIEVFMQQLVQYVRTKSSREDVSKKI